MNYSGQICPICFESYADKSVGSPNTCNHRFCLECILKWAKDSDICPVDRVSFDNVDIIHEDSFLGKVNVCPPKKKKKIVQRYDFTRVCDICQNESKQKIVILCDACDLAFHTKCLEPPLTHIPEGEWYCSTCSRVFSEVGKTKQKHGRVSHVGHLHKGKKKVFSTGTCEVKEGSISFQQSTSTDLFSSKALSQDDQQLRSEASHLHYARSKTVPQPISFIDLKRNARITSDGELVFTAKTAVSTTLHNTTVELHSESVPLVKLSGPSTAGVVKQQLVPRTVESSQTGFRHREFHLNSKKISIHKDGTIVSLS